MRQLRLRVRGCVSELPNSTNSPLFRSPSKGPGNRFLGCGGWKDCPIIGKRPRARTKEPRIVRNQDGVEVVEKPDPRGAGVQGV